MSDFSIVTGDCVEAMRLMQPESVDSIVTDPPYSLGFMGKKWDSHASEDASIGYWLSGLVDGEGHFRVQKHARGTFSCAFQLKMRRDDRAALVRAQRFLGVGSIADANEPSRKAQPTSVLRVQAKADCLRVVEVFARYPLRGKKLRDFIHWTEAVVEWNAMERGHRWTGRADWSRLEALKKAVESAREYRDPPWSGHGFQDWTREWAEQALRVLKPGGRMLAFGGTRTAHRLVAGIEDAGFTIEDTIAWMYGSGFPKHRSKLKPAYEPICVARKGPVSELNIEDCRLSASGYTDGGQNRSIAFGSNGLTDKQPRCDGFAGRWPANVMLDEEAARLLDEQSGELTSGGFPARRSGMGYHGANGNESVDGFGANVGGASRFFYVAKASRGERNAGLEGMERKLAEREYGDTFARGRNPQSGERTEAFAKPVENHHPTVKPVDLMRYLVRLVTPEGGLVLDPFAGSGTTGVACVLEGRRFVGCELSEEYAEIARRRIGNTPPSLFGGAA